MRRWLALAAAVVVLGTINFLIVAKERLLRAGEPMYLRLGPRDPRSLLQGDYMDLNYDLARQVPRNAPADGVLVVALDGRHEATFVRLHRGEPLEADERRLRYRKRGDRVRLGGETYFFQEGTAAVYESARYGELRVTPSGDAVLVGLRDAELRPLGPRNP